MQDWWKCFLHRSQYTFCPCPILELSWQPFTTMRTPSGFKQQPVMVSSDGTSCTHGTSRGTTQCDPWRQIRHLVSFCICTLAKLATPHYIRYCKFSHHLSPTAEYIDKLQDLVFNDVLDQPETYQDLLRQIPVPDHLCTQFYQPDKQEAVARHSSRFFLSNG